MTAGVADVVLVMKRPGNIRVIEQALAALGISCVAAPGEAALVALLDAPIVPKAALVDMSDFGPRAAPVCELLRNRDLPFIALSTPPGPDSRTCPPFFGAAHYINKPVGKQQLQQLTQQLIQPRWNGRA